MGLTHRSIGRSASDFSDSIIKSQSSILVAMAGNPNVGKSSLFNILTGLRQHTGNWTGKTVGCSVGRLKGNKSRQDILIADLPGTYSLDAQSEEETAALNFLLGQNLDAVIIVCDVMNLERNLLLAYQIMSLSPDISLTVCANLADEAEKKGIFIDPEKLSEKLGCRVILTSAKKKTGIEELREFICNVKKVERSPVDRKNKNIMPTGSFVATAREAVEYSITDTCSDERLLRTPIRKRRQTRADSLIMGKYTAIPIAILMLAFIFWLTIYGANIPSTALRSLFDGLKEIISAAPFWGYLPWYFYGFCVDGVYTTLTWVISVMLPPMAIFFPLFTLLEDIGILPRIAFNFDKCFQKCGSCGKQALTMCMGFGCNAAGVTGCRIIENKRARLISILTNSFVPCNGKFPTLIAIISAFFVGKSSGLGALLLTGIIIFCILMTYAVSRVLAHSVLNAKDDNSNVFVLEIPPYRIPNIGQVLIRSLLDRTLFLVGRAAAVAAPAGGAIWILSNVNINGYSIIQYAINAFDPVGFLLGVDGTVILALLLSIPANELILPVMLMMYSSSGFLTDFEGYESLGLLLNSHGWTLSVAVCFLLLFLFKSPCSTTFITVGKETGRIRYAILSILLPMAVGVTLSFILNCIIKIF